MRPTAPIFCAFLALMMLDAAGARASQEGAVQVSQPIMVFDGGCVVSDVTYILTWGWYRYAPELTTSLTVSANSISTSQGFANRNGAAALDLRLEFPDGDEIPGFGSEGHRERFQGLFGDTLRVVLDLTSMKRGAESEWPGSEADVVAATVESLKLNARREWPRVRTLDLRVRGPSEFQAHAGVYPLDAVVHSPLPKSVQAANEVR